MRLLVGFNAPVNETLGYSQGTVFNGATVMLCERQRGIGRFSWHIQGLFEPGE